eukprot:jgi/Bigna1/60399/fgenesh1_kg.11_\
MVDAMLKIVRAIVSCPESRSFRQPVARNVPNYYNVIKRPMDFSTLEANAKSRKYSTPAQFWDDVELIRSNCVLYNTINHHLSKNIMKVLEIGRKLKASQLDNLPLPRPRQRQDSVRSNKRKRSSSRRTPRRTPSRVGSYASPSSEVLSSQRTRTSSRGRTGPRERAASPSRLPRAESSISIMSVKSEVAAAAAVERSPGGVDIDDDDLNLM